MPNAITLKTIGDWRKEVGVPMRTVLAISMDVIGRSGEEACRHSMILMSQSAGALAAKSPKNRKIEHDFSGGRDLPFVTIYNRNKPPSRAYKFQFGEKSKAANRIPGTWANARVIGGRGLAGRSWSWGLARIGGKAQSKGIRGTYRLITINQNNVNGYIKENRLDYILKAMPSGWERMVEMAAGNKIMNAAVRKLESIWRREVGAAKGAKIPREDLARFFQPGAS